LLPDLAAAQRVATERASPDDPDLPPALDTYATDLLLLHIEDGEVGPLDEAVSALRRAVELARRNDLRRNLPSLLNNLAAILLSRRAATGNDDDLDRAIITLDEAAATAPIGPLRARLLDTLADLLTQRYAIHQDGADATRAERLRAEAERMR
jgi:tetratricopeptide (TPR) repeat protein